MMTWLACPTHAGWWLAQPPEVEEQVLLNFGERPKEDPGIWAWVPKRLLYPGGGHESAQELIDAGSGRFWGWEFKELTLPEGWPEEEA